MKRSALLLVLAVGLATSARAAFNAAADGGYLLDNQDPYWSVRAGGEFAASNRLSHQVNLEYAWSSHAETVTLLGPVTGRTRLRFTTINYRAETTAADRLGFYFGAGAGSASARLSFAGSGVPSINDSASALTLQAFAGVSYHATPTVTLHAGAKYLWVDDMKLFSGNVEVGDDVALTAGVSIRF